MSPKVSEDHKETRSKTILAAAREVFSTKGYAAASMKDVVDMSGMSRGSVYMYFPSTEAMMLALIEDNNQTGFEHIGEMVETSESVWSIIVQLIRSSEANVSEMTSGFAAALYEFHLMQWRSLGMAPTLQKARYSKVVETLITILQLGVDRGEFQPLSPVADVARIMVSIMDGWVLDCTYLGPDNIKLHNQLEVSLQMLQAILQPQVLPVQK